MKSIPSIWSAMMSGLTVFLLTVPSLDAATTRTWTGEGGDNDWFNSANWEAADASDNVPQANDTVVIDSGSVLLNTSTPQLASLTLAGATLTFTNWTTALKADTVVIDNGGTLTLPGDFANDGMSNRVWIICHNFTLENGGEINANARGFAKFYGPGAGGMNAGGNNGGGGGGYGGWGGRGSGGNVGNVYGTPEAPEFPGSGSGGYSFVHAGGAAGGGAVRIAATGTVTINGNIFANGGHSSNSYGGGGSGGGVWISSDTFGGTDGSILANGGNGGSLSGKGGGGRIAVTYNQLAGTPTVSFSVNAASSGWSPAKDINMPTHPAAPHIGSLYFTNADILQGLLVDSGTRIEGLNGYLWFATPSDWPPVSLTTLTQSTIGILEGQTMEFSQGLVLDGGGIMVREHAELVVGGDLILTNNAHMAVYSGETNGVDIVDGSVVRVSQALNVNAGSWLYPFAHNTNGATALFDVGSLSIAAGGGINADFAGYRDRFGPGKGADSTGAAGGGGYGGQGGSANGGSPYGDPIMPVHPGSGAGRYTETHPAFSHGGGAIRIRAMEHVEIEGTLTANGQSNGSWAGGSSGGGIFITCGSIQVSENATLRANGGNGGTSGTHKGGGGGGRIAIIYGAPFSPDLHEGRLQISEEPPASVEGTFEVLAGSGGSPAPDNGSLRFVHVLPIQGSLMMFR